MTTGIGAGSPRYTARLAGGIYVLTFVAGGLAFFVRGTPGMVFGLVAGLSYVAVTLLFYVLFKPVSPGFSLLAAVVSLVGIVMGPLTMLHVVPFRVNSLVFFGVYCLMIGVLIFRSTFLPRFLGALMAFAGLGWLTFLSPPLVQQLTPFVFFPGLLGEGALTLWLVAKGVDEPRWRAQAGASPSVAQAIRESTTEPAGRAGA
jgi:hypothetical protein